MMIMAKNILFVLVLLYAAYYDYKYRIIPDKVHVIIIALGLINTNLLDSFLGLVLVPLPVLIIGVTKGGIGGGDIKLIGSSSFFLGVSGGICGTVLGIFIAVVVNFLYNLIKGQSVGKAFALGPYLVVGYMMMLL